MHIPHTKEEKQKLLSELPEPLRSVIQSDATSNTFLELREKFDLRVDQSGATADVALLVLLGVFQPNQFVTELRKKVDLSQEKLETIAEYINERVFAPARNALLQAQHSRESQITHTPTKEVSANAPFEDVPGLERTMPQDLAEAKLGGSVHLPKASITKEQSSQPTPERKQDPYREPIE